MRKISFGENGSIFLENILLFLRLRQIKKYLKNIGNKKVICDIGCGYNAKSLQELLKNFPEIEKCVGVDISINKNLNIEKINLIKSDLNKALPINNDSFDVVISLAVIEHLDNYNLVIREMHRILKTGGYLFLTTPSKFSKPILEFLAFKLKILDETEIRDHKKYFLKNELKEILKNYLLNDIKIKSFQLGLNTLVVCRKN